MLFNKDVIIKDVIIIIIIIIRKIRHSGPG